MQTQKRPCRGTLLDQIHQAPGKVSLIHAFVPLTEQQKNNCAEIWVFPFLCCNEKCCDNTVFYTSLQNLLKKANSKACL
jgi:hypothetical protein